MSGTVAPVAGAEVSSCVISMFTVLSVMPISFRRCLPSGRTPRPGSCTRAVDACRSRPGRPSFPLPALRQEAPGAFGPRGLLVALAFGGHALAVALRDEGIQIRLGLLARGDIPA